MDQTDSEHPPDTLTRSPRVAELLTILCPGLGYMYVGDLVRAVTINLVFLFLLELFVISWATLKFFPLMPLLVFGLAWIIATGTVANKAAHLAARTRDEPFKPRGFNHWIMYLGLFAFTYVIPIGLSAQFVFDHLWNLNVVRSSSTHPSLRFGDIALVDLNAFNERPPTRGDLVLFDVPDEADTRRLARIIASQGDTISLEGQRVVINDARLPVAPLEAPEDKLKSNVKNHLLTHVELNEGARYAISLAPAAPPRPFPTIKLGKDEYFLVADNRAQLPAHDASMPIRDSRNFGPVHRGAIVGKPTHVAFATQDDADRVDWTRVGVRLR